MSDTKNTVYKALELQNRDQSYPAVNLVNIDPQLAAVVSKLVLPLTPPTHNAKGEREITSPAMQNLQNQIHHKARDIDDAETVLQLLPDIKQAGQVLVSAILSPKDMMATDFTFVPPEGVLNSPATQALVQVIREHFTNSYKIKPLLGDILHKILMETGSHALVCLPENSVDEAINRPGRISMEDLKEIADTHGNLNSLGILGPREVSPQVTTRRNQVVAGVSLEHLTTYEPPKNTASPVKFKAGAESTALEDISHLVVSDNFNLLKLPLLAQKVREQRIRASSGLNNALGDAYDQAHHEAMENFNTANPSMGKVLSGAKIPNFSDAKLSGLLYKGRSNGYTPIMSLKTDAQLERKAVGVPLVMELPSESVIPVFMPGHPSRHVGYFIALDAHGNPLNRKDGRDHYAELGDRLKQGSNNGGYQSSLLNRLKAGMGNFDCNNREHLDAAAKIYAEMVEQDLLMRLKNGVYSNGVALARNEEVYRLMLSRVLASQHTQLLFVPVEFMTYFAFDYHDNGMGKSLLDDMKVINSLRAVMMFSGVMAGVRNSIPATAVNIKLDEDDPDPSKTIELIQDTLARLRSQSFPLGASSPVDIVNYLQRAGYRWAYEGHPGFPDVKIDMTETTSGYNKPDTETEELLRKRSINGIGVPPEMVDGSTGTDFAANVIQNNVMLSRTVMIYQDKFTPLLMRNFRQVIQATPALIDELLKVVEEHFDANQERLSDEEKQLYKGPKARTYAKHKLLSDFINGLTVELPRPNTVTMENQEKAFDQYSQLLDKALDAYFSTKFITKNMVGDISGQVEVIKEVVKAHYLRTWLAENGVLPELANLTGVDEEGNAKLNLWDDNVTLMKDLSRSLGQFMVHLQPIIAQSDATLQANNIQADDGGGGGYGGGDSYGGSSGGDAGGGSDPFGESGGDDPFGGSGTDDGTGDGTDTGQDDQANPDQTDQNNDTNSGEQTQDGEESDQEAKGNGLL